jgi:hypothetical protein
MDPIIIKVFIEYGLLGLGWIFTIWLAKELLKAKQELICIIKGNTEAITKLAERITYDDRQ